MNLITLLMLAVSLLQGNRERLGVPISDALSTAIASALLNYAISSGPAISTKHLKMDCAAINPGIKESICNGNHAVVKYPGVVDLDLGCSTIVQYC